MRSLTEEVASASSEGHGDGPTLMASNVLGIVNSGPARGPDAGRDRVHEIPVGP